MTHTEPSRDSSDYNIGMDWDGEMMRKKRVDAELAKVEKGLYGLMVGISIPLLALVWLTSSPVETEPAGAVAPHNCGVCHVEEG